MIDKELNKRVHAQAAGRYPFTLRLVTFSKAELWSAVIESSSVDITTLPVEINPNIKRIDVPVSIELVINGQSEVLRD
jgi:hypothetical protein